MTVAEVEIPPAQFLQRVAGTQFARATCIVCAGAGGNCVDDQVTCSESGSPITCPSEATPTIAVQTGFSTSQAITNAGYLTTPIGKNEWQNIFTGFSDPTVRGKTNVFSEFVAVDLKGRVATTCVINSSSNLFSAGQRITFTARVTVPSTTGTPTGTITFHDSADSLFVLGTAPLVEGTASIKAVLHAPPPRQWVGAVYSGDNNFQSCKSPYIPEDYSNN
jgi:hypothetical protein